MSTVQQPEVFRGLTKVDEYRRNINEIASVLAEVIDRKGARHVPQLAAAEKALREAARKLYAGSTEWDRRDTSVYPPE